MKKLIAILSVIICLGLGGWLIASHYTNLKEERFNNIIENANKAIENKEYETAEVILEKAKLMNNKTQVICKKIQNLEFHKEQQELYDQGLRLEKLKRYSEAIDVFSEIDVDSNDLKRNSEKEIEICKKCIIDDFSNKADKAIRRGDIEKAKYIIAKIERVDSDSPEINILNMKIENFKSAPNKYQEYLIFIWLIFLNNIFCI
ncbi:YdgA family protein [Clostridium perfringens]|nr:YdgA family protein [Clostridium perfringens]